MASAPEIFALSLALRRRHRAHTPPEQLAAEWAMTPNRLAAALDALTALGFVVESHPIQGLRLLQAPPALLEEELAYRLGVAKVGRHVRCIEETASTNDLAWQAALEGPRRADGLVLFAEHQTAGRGRRAARWFAPPHSSLLVSVLLWTPYSPGQAAVLTRAAALAAAEAVEELADLEVGIKWPNDVVIDDRKVGGILVEVRPTAGQSTPVVIGIGLNCTQGEETFPPAIRPYVTSLAMAGQEVDRTLLARTLLRRLDHLLMASADPAAAADVTARAAARCKTLGRRITLRQDGHTFTGQVIALDADYGLVLRLEEGEIRRFPAMTSHVLGQSDAT